MVTATSIVTEGPRVDYNVICERVAPFLNNKFEDGFLYDTVRDAVIQVCRDLDFLRTEYKMERAEDHLYTLDHQGYSFGNGIRSWHDIKDGAHQFPARAWDNISIKINHTEIALPSDLTQYIREYAIFLVSVTPNRNSEDFPATVYDQEAELLIMRARTMMKEFDPNPVPEAAYREKVGRAYSRYMSTLGEETINMYLF